MAIKESKVSRSEIFITTKVSLFTIKKGEEAVLESIRKSLLEIDCDYIDLLLLHAPYNGLIRDSWGILERVHTGEIPEFKNKIRFIGVSNYDICHLTEILKFCKIKPYTNQIECSPFWPRDELVNFCVKNQIKVTAHSSLTKGEKFNDELLVTLCEKYGITPACFLLRWGLQRGFTVIPRTKNYEHLKENKDSIDSSVIIRCEDMDRLKPLGMQRFATHKQYL